MKKYEKELKAQLDKAKKIGLAGLGFAVVAQRKLEKAVKAFIGKSKAEAKAKTKKLVVSALKEQKVAQKTLKTETNKALTMMVKESQKRLKKFQEKIGKKKQK